ncbi:MAG: Gfo/Idh/MocA family oxidoreductase [Oscillospiraceae bacterium]|jgi:predicted dehydrogenase|nr:Gfo/Idh/MocA family oxidoreductase [Oscillospiraceae bacterium]
MSKIKLGIIGIGNMGTNHVQNILAGKTPDITLSAIADRSPERREFAQKNFPGIPLFEEGDAMITSGVCDSILIAVPHYQHTELAIRAFEKGLHVLCEKPAGVYTLQVREMNAAAKKSGKTFGMMFNQRTDCVYRKMKEIISSGDMGAIKRVNWIITDWYRTRAYYDSGSWRATWDGEGGGVLLNQCPHNLDLLQWICGLPTRVRSFCHNGKWHDIEVEDDVTAYLEFENGATGVFITTTGDLPGTNRLEITLEMGKLICEGGKVTMHKLEQNERDFCLTAAGGFDKQPVEITDVELDGENPQHVGVLNAFAGNILRGTPLIADGQEGINGLMLSNAIHLSSWLDATVDIPFDEELFLVELNKRRATSKKKDVAAARVFDATNSFGT